MNRRMRLYYYAVLGAGGGLVGWQLSDLLGLSFTRFLFLNEMLVGALIGLSVGLLIGITEGAVMFTPLRALRAGLFGGGLGLVAGAVGLPLGELAFQLTGGAAV